MTVCMSVVGGGAGGATEPVRRKEMERIGVNRGDMCGRLRITALLCTGGASADVLGAGKQFLMEINQIYPSTAWTLLRGGLSEGESQGIKISKSIN